MIELQARNYANAREKLATTVACLNDELDDVKKKYLARIRAQVAEAKTVQAGLRALIEAAPELFVKPRTVILHGIKVGYRKATGKIEFDDADQVVKLIRKHFPEQFDVLVKIEETPVKKALANLTAAELKKLGIEVSDSGDEVEIRDTAGDVDKLVAALLKDYEEAA
jgi:phage host-nuclease inhibitor protein Gam